MSTFRARNANGYKFASKFAVNMAFLQKTQPDLHKRVVADIKARGADPERVAVVHVDLEEAYENNEAFRDLQAYVREDQQKQAEARTAQQQANDEQAAYEFWEKKVQEGSFVDTQKNRIAVAAYLLNHNQLPSVATVQAAIMALYETLDKPEVLGTLPNGERQLSIDASEWEMKRASVHQLRDLSARRFEGKSRPTGSFGGRF